MSTVWNWEEKYQVGTTRWERGHLNPAFIAWRTSGELAPCRILIPGCGRSYEPAELAQTGFDVTATDVAPSAIAAQQQRLGSSGRAIVADLFSWEPEAPFDAIYDQTCLCALPPVLLPEYEARLARWLRPGGALFVLFMQTGREDGPPFDCPLPRMRELFAPSRWLWPAVLPNLVKHPSGVGDEQPAILRCR